MVCSDVSRNWYFLNLHLNPGDIGLCSAPDLYSFYPVVPFYSMNHLPLYTVFSKLLFHGFFSACTLRFIYLPVNSKVCQARGALQRKGPTGIISVLVIQRDYFCVGDPGDFFCVGDPGDYLFIGDPGDYLFIGELEFQEF